MCVLHEINPHDIYRVLEHALFPFSVCYHGSHLFIHSTKAFDEREQAFEMRGC